MGGGRTEEAPQKPPAELRVDKAPGCRWESGKILVGEQGSVQRIAEPGVWACTLRLGTAVPKFPADNLELHVVPKRHQG